MKYFNLKEIISARYQRYKNSMQMLELVKANKIYKFVDMRYNWNEKKIDLDINFNDWQNRSILKWAVINNASSIVSCLMHEPEIDLEDQKSFYNQLKKISKKIEYTGWACLLMLVMVSTNVLPLSVALKERIQNWIGFNVGTLISYLRLQYYLIDPIASQLLFYTETPFEIAIQKGYTRIVEILFKKMPSNQDRRPISNTQLPKSIYLATMYGHVEMIKRFVLHLDVCDTVNYKDSSGYTPLMLAARLNKAELVKVLLTSPHLKLDHYETRWFSYLRMGDDKINDKIAELSGDKKLFNVALDPNKHSSADIHKALQWAMHNEYQVLVMKLLQSDNLDIHLIDLNLAKAIDLLCNRPLHMTNFNIQVLLPEIIDSRIMVRACLFPDEAPHLNSLKRALEAAAFRNNIALVKSLLEKYPHADLFDEKIIYSLFTQSPNVQQSMLNIILQDVRVQSHLLGSRSKLLAKIWNFSSGRSDEYEFKNQLLELFALPENKRTMKALLENNVVRYSFFQEYGTQLANLWSICRLPIQKILMEHIRLLGFSLSELGVYVGQYRFFAAIKIIQFYDGVMTGKGYSKAQRQALQLMNSSLAVEAYECELHDPHQNETNADNHTFAARGRHFIDKIKPAVEAELNIKYGNKIIDSLEALIRNDILNEIFKNALFTITNLNKKQSLSETDATELDNANQCLDFIKAMQSNAEQWLLLISGQDENLMKQASQLFSSNHNAPYMAWRCYDKFGKASQHWPNLLIPQISNEKIYSIIEVFEGELSAKKGSELGREIMAYTYYALIEGKKDLKSEEKQNRVIQFVARLAEIQRTNNNSETQKGDEPSCIVGIYSRAAKCWEMDLSLAQARNDKEKCIFILKNKITKAFDEALKACLNEKDKKHLYKSLTDLCAATAEDYLKKPEQKNQFDQKKLEKRAHLAELREKFMRSLGTSEVILEDINHKLRADKLDPIDKKSLVYINSLLSDPGGGWISVSLTETYLRHRELTQKALSPSNNESHSIEAVMVHQPRYLTRFALQQQIKASSNEPIFNRMKKY